MTSSATNPRAARLASLPRATLVERQDITEDLMVVKFRPDNPGFTFKPGQYCTLGTDGIERAYSIASAPYEGVLETFVELVPEGSSPQGCGISGWAIPCRCGPLRRGCS